MQVKYLQMLYGLLCFGFFTALFPVDDKSSYGAQARAPVRCSSVGTLLPVRLRLMDKAHCIFEVPFTTHVLLADKSRHSDFTSSETMR